MPVHELDPEVAARRAAALAHVRTFGDPVLKARAVPVERFDDELRAEVVRMAAIMHDGLGVGLAATQLGVMHRVLVYQLGGDAPLAALVNPDIEWRSDDEETSRRAASASRACTSTSNPWILTSPRLMNRWSIVRIRPGRLGLDGG